MKRLLSIGLALVAIALGQPAGVRQGQLVTAGTGGVTQNLLAAKDTSNPTVWVLPAAGGCGAGIAASNATAGNTFYLQNVSGSILTGVADGTITAGHILTGGSSTPGRVADTGQTSAAAVSNSICIAGIALAGATVGNTVSILYEGPGLYGSALTAANVPAAPLTAGTSVTLAAPRGYYVCTNTCAITLPAPAAGYEFCVLDDANVTAAITFNSTTNIYYEKPDHSGYGTVGNGTTNGTLVSTAGTWSKMCLIGRSATQWNIASSQGAWTAN